MAEGPGIEPGPAFLRGIGLANRPVTGPAAFHMEHEAGIEPAL
jgi:hypothetical protein